MGFSDNLRRICTMRGTNPTTLCKELGLSTSKVSAWYKGSLPKQETMYLLASKLNCSVADFFIEDNTQPIDPESAVNSLENWLFDHGFEIEKVVGFDEKGVEEPMYLIEKDGERIGVNREEFLADAIELREQIKYPEHWIYDNWANKLFKPRQKETPSLDEDETDIISMFRSLSRRGKHEFMTMFYDFQDRIKIGMDN